MEDLTFPIPNLTNDVLIEILALLPVKPLLRFKSVCKLWRTLISSQLFVRAHLENSKKSKSDPNLAHGILILENPGNVRLWSVNSILYESVSEELDLGFPFKSEIRFRLLGWCNGLILVLVHKDLFLCNPATRTFKKLPDFCVEIAKVVRRSYGLGYDKSSDDYKVVGFFGDDRDLSEVMVLVYSLRNDQWKRIKNLNGHRMMEYRAAFVNGKLYWIVNRNGDGWDIVSFDLEEDEHEILQMPSSVHRGHCWHLQVCEGSLCLMCIHETSGDVWIMDGCSVVGTENWTKVAEVPCPTDHICILFAYVLKNGLVLVRYDTTFVLYDPKDCLSRYPDIRGSREAPLHVLNLGVCDYRESLVSPLG